MAAEFDSGQGDKETSESRDTDQEASPKSYPTEVGGSSPKASQKSSISRRDEGDADLEESDALVYPVIPVTGNRPVRSEFIAMVNPTVMQALAQNAPERVLQFAEDSDERQFQYYLRGEDNRHKERLNGENTKRIAIGGILFTVVSVLTYSAFTGDTGLSETIIIVIISAFGGLGLKTLLKSEEE